MVRVVCIAMAIIFVLVGCNDGLESKELIEYDKEVINSVGKLNELDFNLEVPNLLPFEPTETEVDVMNLGGTEDSFVTVTFENKNRDKVILRAGITENAIDFTEDKINIAKNLAGRYGEKDNTKVLKWDKDNIYYELLVEGDSISKDEILETAKSFYQIS